MKETEGSTRRPSVMDAFMIQKARAYREPQRQGIPRGWPMRFSTPKFRAAVCCLKCTHLREIASAVPVSYGLLRKWRTETRFLSLMATLSTEFVDQAVMGHLKRRVEVQMGLDDAYSAKTITDIAETPPPRLGWTEFSDVRFYSEGLLGRLADKLRKTRADLMRGTEQRSDMDVFNRRRDALYQALQCEGLLALVKTHVPTLTKDPRSDVNPARSCGEAQRDAEYERSLTMLVEGPLGQDERKRIIAVLHRLRGRFTVVEMEHIGVEGREARRQDSRGSHQKPIGRHLL